MTTEYDYDERGNLIREKGGELSKLYSYDGFNRLVRVQNPDGTYMENIYDAENLRTVSIENGKYNRYIYNGRNIACEVDENWELKDRIVREHTILEKEDSNKDTYYYIHNAHGDVTALTNGRGEVVNSYSYDAFGNILDSVEKVDNRFKYSGELHDSVTDQYYLRARHYNPSIGRFMQEDSFRGDGLNLYTYVANNPIKYIDPTGHCKEGVNFIDAIGNALGINLNGIIRKIPGVDWISDCFDNIFGLNNGVLTKLNFIQISNFSEKLVSNVTEDVNQDSQKSWTQVIVDKLKEAYVKATEFHFEKRDELNGPHPSYSDVIADNSSWTLLPPSMSIYHDNGMGKPELKFVHPDGREAVFDGDTLQPMTNPRYKGTYNYVVPVEPPEDILDIGGWYNYATRGIGHVVLDVIPYWLTGKKNERNQ